MKTGTLYWITGLAGAGKTTIGREVYALLKQKKDNLVFLDGDILRPMLGDIFGYSYDERLRCAQQYSRICKMLTDQGLDVIICTISMFQSVRKWNRDNFEHYFEVFVDTPMEILKSRNKKNLYGEMPETDNSMVAGVSFAVELPENPDFWIKNDMTIEPREWARRILEAGEGKNEEDILYAESGNH